MTEWLRSDAAAGGGAKQRRGRDLGVTGSRGDDYSRLSIAELTERLEDSLLRHADLVETAPAFGGLLSELHGMWSETIAHHLDPVGALVREVENNGGFPDFAEAQVFDDDTGDIDILSLLILVSLRRTAKHRRAAGTSDPAETL